MKSRIISLHRTFSKEKKGEPIFFVAEGNKTMTLSTLKLRKLLMDIKEPLTIRVTSRGYFLPALAEAQAKGVIIVSAHWHDTGIESGLKPEEIALRFLRLPEDLFSEFQQRLDLFQLRLKVSLRLALMDYRMQVTQKIQAVTRGHNLSDDADERPEALTEVDASVDHVKKQGETIVDKEISKLALEIPECVLWNKVLGIKGEEFRTESALAAYLGDISRFPTISALWHYCGYHVTPEGKAPKRAAGKPMDWNPTLRKTLWTWAKFMSISPARSPWRDSYEFYFNAEMNSHGERHKDCSKPKSHCAARACRRVVKDVLKEYYLTARNVPPRIEKVAA